jgi:hypothetical protein
VRLDLIARLFVASFLAPFVAGLDLIARLFVASFLAPFVAGLA